jgi:hypothetical protein
MNEEFTREDAEAWVKRFLALSEEDRVHAAATILSNAHAAWRCRSEAHMRYVREYKEMRRSMGLSSLP